MRNQILGGEQLVQQQLLIGLVGGRMSVPEQSGQQGHVAFNVEWGLKKSGTDRTVVEAVVASM
jgi:hypothetical protein